SVLHFVSLVHLCSKMPESRGFSCAAATGLEHSVKSASRPLAPGALDDAPPEPPVLFGGLPGQRSVLHNRVVVPVGTIQWPSRSEPNYSDLADATTRSFSTTARSNGLLGGIPLRLADGRCSAIAHALTTGLCRRAESSFRLAGGNRRRRIREPPG